MKKKYKGEKPFEFLRHKETNEPFSEEIVRNWYVARAFVLERLSRVSFAPGTNGHLHVEIEGDSPLMLSVLRQVALSAHYPNFVEYDRYGHLVCRNRTVITLVSNREPEKIVSELKKEENLGNLLDYCKYTVYGNVKNEDSFIDIELEIVNEPGRAKDYSFCESEVHTFEEQKENKEALFSIDTRKAVYASRAYELGTVIESIPYEDINDAGRYNRALDTFQYKVLQGKKELTLIKDKWKNDLIAVKNGLSNIICADSFESRELAIKLQYPDYDKLSSEEQNALWERDTQAFSVSEHSRWVVEKLILGFSPLNAEQRNEYERLFGENRKAFGKQLKSNPSYPAHIDICSNRDLRRVDPDNKKYDSFLMLAIPMILDTIRKQDGPKKKQEENPAQDVKSR